jgi:hypothetical protein
MPKGRPFKYSAKELMQLFIEYKEFRNKQYDIRYELIKSGEKAGTTAEIKIPKVPTIASFCHYINTTEKTFNNWLNEVSEEIDDDLLQFITYVREEIKDLQYSGAVNGIYNSMIVARMNGITEQVHINQNININAIPVHLSNTIIDLTDKEYQILSDNNIIQSDNNNNFEMQMLTQCTDNIALQRTDI